MKLLSLGGLIVFGLLAPARVTVDWVAPLPHANLWAAMALALVAVVGNFDGWYQATLSAGEIKRPERNLPLGMIGGTALVGLLYLLVNVVYFRALPIAAFGESTRIGEEATTALLGPAAGRFLAAVVLVSIFGCISSTIIGASRLGLPMAEDAPALRWLARIHPRYRTPTTGIVTLGVWSIVLVLSGSYEALFNYALFASFIFHAITAIALFALRRQQPDRRRVPIACSAIPTCRRCSSRDDRPGPQHASRTAARVAARRRHRRAWRAAVLLATSGSPRNERGPGQPGLSMLCADCTRCDGLVTADR